MQLVAFGEMGLLILYTTMVVKLSIFPKVSIFPKINVDRKREEESGYGVPQILCLETCSSLCVCMTLTSISMLITPNFTYP